MKIIGKTFLGLALITLLAPAMAEVHIIQGKTAVASPIIHQSIDSTGKPKAIPVTALLYVGWGNQSGCSSTKLVLKADGWLNNNDVVRIGGYFGKENLKYSCGKLVYSDVWGRRAVDNFALVRGRDSFVAANPAIRGVVLK